MTKKQIQQSGITNIITLGAEEELQVTDEDGGLATHDFVRSERDVPHNMPGTLSCEMHRCVIEIKTPVIHSPTEVVMALAGLRNIAAMRAKSQSQNVLSAGLHPFSCGADQQVNGHLPHYAHLLQEYCDVARGAISFGLHVHLSVSHPELRMPVMNCLRNRLPMIMALSASSPFFQGKDTGLQSWRHCLLERYPRTGIADVWSSEAEYWAYIHRLRRLNILEATGSVWEDLRIHPHFLTLEIRIADAVHSLDRIWLIVALLQAEVATLEADVLQGTNPEPLPRLLVDENKWRARRYGMQAQLVDWHNDCKISFKKMLWQWIARIDNEASRLGFSARLQAAAEASLEIGTAADQQRLWLAESSSMITVVKRLEAETARPLSPYLLIRER